MNRHNNLFQDFTERVQFIIQFTRALWLSNKTARDTNERTNKIFESPRSKISSSTTSVETEVLFFGQVQSLSLFDYSYFFDSVMKNSVFIFERFNVYQKTGLLFKKIKVSTSSNSVELTVFL